MLDFSKQVGPFVGVAFDQIVTFKIGRHTRKFRVIAYQAYNARGLIGSEFKRANARNFFGRKQK
jgi:hypothetical protein